jgi:hypothetical protein
MGTANPAEPIPGYRLIERLGHGGFGEVWKAEAPGGLFKAIKFVYGSLSGAIDEEVRVRQELKALERVKTVRHPYILSLERYDIIDGRLVIVMELADSSLWDRFKECRAQGLSGIPRDELLRYMEETAEALDLMNTQYQLQHLDIKPQNLFLLYNHIKVGDFGLVKDLEGVRTQATSGVTAVYASPETFEGLVSRFCDQYNLAIVYQELLTGQLPFEGTNPRQLMMKHLTAAPDLLPLPPGDRDAIARALAKKPEDRHPSCSDLVRALRRGTLSESTPPPPAPVPGSGLRKSTPASDTCKTTLSLVKKHPVPPPRPEVTGPGVLFPALVIGVGGVALGVLQQLRKALYKRYGPATALPHLRLLQLDTDAEVLDEAKQADPDAGLSESQLFLTRLHRSGHYLKLGGDRQALQPWLPLAILSRLARDQLTAAGCRALGRLAFISNFPALAARLRDELEACLDPQALTLADRQTGLGLRTNRPRVYVVAGLAGGTGSGMLIDLAYAVRYLLKQLGYASPEVVGLCLLPSAKRGAAAPRALANAYAALTELNHFAAAQTQFSVSYKDCPEPVTDLEPPFSRCLLLPLPDEAEGAKSLGELAALAGEFLCRDLVTPLGRAADQTRAARPAPNPGLTYQTFGTYWFAVPRQLLIKRMAQCLCQRLVQGWRAEAQTGLDQAIQAWLAGQFTQRELSIECVLARLQAACAPALGQESEVAGDAPLQQWTKGGSADLTRYPAAAGDAVAEVERLVGRPGDAARPGATALGDALNEAVPALAAEVETQLAEVALCAVAEPQFRLTGAEEAVQNQLLATLTEAARQEKALAKRHFRQAADLYPSLAPLVETLRKSSLLGWGKAKAAGELLDLLRAYWTARWQGLLHERLRSLYQDLLGNLHKHLREVSCCHRRIADFLRSFDDPAKAGQSPVDLGLGQYLLPTGCRTLDEGAALILGALTPEELHELNTTVQRLIGQKFQAQVHVCTAPANFFKELEEAVHQQVAAFAEAQLGRAHAAQMYLEQHTEDETMHADLVTAFDEAIPELAGSRLSAADEIRILAVPPGPEGEYFRTLVRQALPDQDMVAAASTDDIVFYREQPHVPLASLPQLGPAAQEAYQQLLAPDQLMVHSRADVTEWLPVTGS